MKAGRLAAVKLSASCQSLSLSWAGDWRGGAGHAWGAAPRGGRSRKLQALVELLRSLH